MSSMTSSTRKYLQAGTSALVLAAALALAACGGSSTSTSSTARASASAAVGGAPGRAPGDPGGPGGRFAKVRECLQKNGITLPQRTPGQQPPAAGSRAPRQLPNGVSRAQFQAALKKCGGSPGGLVGRRAGLGSAQSKQALTKFAACMKDNGVTIPPPNTSGNGPIFDTRGLNTSSATFKAAESKCRGALPGAFRARPGGAGAPPGVPAG